MIEYFSQKVWGHTSSLWRKRNVPDKFPGIRGIEMYKDKKTVVGKKQTLRALLRDEAETVFLAKDADLHVTKEIADICKEKNVELIYYDSMKELGKSVGIGVNAAAAAVLK
jgi:large subunit ribosomal protein L7A